MFFDYLSTMLILGRFGGAVVFTLLSSCRKGEGKYTTESTENTEVGLESEPANSTIEINIFIFNWHGRLEIEQHSSKLEFIGAALFICRF